MINKGVLIGTFVKKHKILSFIERIRNFTIKNIDRIFVYEIKDNEKEYLVTFKLLEKEKNASKFYNSTILHVKNGCLFSINALNSVINENKVDNTLSNKDIAIDWEKYRGKLLIKTNGELIVHEIAKIEDKSVFFNT